MFLFAQTAPALAAADTVSLKITNRTGVVVTLILRGPQYYALQVKTGNSTHTILRGDYQWSFSVAGLSTQGKLDASNSKAELTLNKLTDTFTVNNRASDGVILYLNGRSSYRFPLKYGTNKIEVVGGAYKYTYSACGKTYDGKIDTRSKPSLKLEDCSGGGGEFGQGRITVSNKTGATMTLSLTGPKNYYWTLQPGKVKFDIPNGTYTYRAYGCNGNSKTGTIKLKGSLTWEWSCRKE
jgi:hypothetical protein